MRKLALVWVALNTLDFILTWAVISANGTEAMPVAKYFIGYGIIWFALFKTVFTIGGAILLSKFRPKLMQVCNMAFGCIIGWNIVALAICKI